VATRSLFLLPTSVCSQSMQFFFLLYNHVMHSLRCTPHPVRHVLHGWPFLDGHTDDHSPLPFSFLVPLYEESFDLTFRSRFSGIDGALEDCFAEVGGVFSPPALCPSAAGVYTPFLMTPVISSRSLKGLTALCLPRLGQVHVFFFPKLPLRKTFLSFEQI